MKSAILKLSLPLGILAFCFCLATAFKTDDVMLAKLCSALSLVTILFLSAAYTKAVKNNTSDGNEYEL